MPGVFLDKERWPLSGALPDAATSALQPKGLGGGAHLRQRVRLGPPVVPFHSVCGYWRT